MVQTTAVSPRSTVECKRIGTVRPVKLEVLLIPLVKVWVIDEYTPNVSPE
jgi:hypothetical protein